MTDQETREEAAREDATWEASTWEGAARARLRRALERTVRQRLEVLEELTETAEKLAAVASTVDGSGSTPPESARDQA